MSGAKLMPLEQWKAKVAALDWSTVTDSDFYGWIGVCEHSGPNDGGGPRGDGMGRGRGRGYHYGPSSAVDSPYGGKWLVSRWKVSCTCLGVCQRCATFCSADCPPPTCRIELLGALMHANPTYVALVYPAAVRE